MQFYSKCSKNCIGRHSRNYPFTTSKIFGKCLQSAYACGNTLWNICTHVHLCMCVRDYHTVTHCSHCIFISRPRGESGIKANTWPLKLVRVSLKEGKNHCYCIAIYKSSHLFLTHTDTHTVPQCVLSFCLYEFYQ